MSIFLLPIFFLVYFFASMDSETWRLSLAEARVEGRFESSIMSGRDIFTLLLVHSGKEVGFTFPV